MNDNTQEKNLIKKNEKYSRITGKLNRNNIDSKFEIILDKNKTLMIDEDIIKKSSDYISNINIIIFYPDDLDLIKGNPSIRRRFINLELSQLYSNYLVILNDYNKLLKMRNDYLKQIDICFDSSYFEILTNYLIDKAIIIYKMRNKFINKLNSYTEKIYKDISTIDKFHINYKTGLHIESFETNELKKQLIQEYNNALENDKKYKTTTIGPHKDDLEFYIDKFNIKTYGSQGQQRMAVLAIKLAEIEIFKNYKQDTPILLLDDVFSELDDQKKNNLLKYIDSGIQTIITTTDLNNIDNDIINKSKLIQINNGNII